MLVLALFHWHYWTPDQVDSEISNTEMAKNNSNNNGNNSNSNDSNNNCL